MRVALLRIIDPSIKNKIFQESIFKISPTVLLYALMQLNVG